MAFSIDSDFTTYSDAEQMAIQRIWLRVAEDYAPFDVDITTERTTMAISKPPPPLWSSRAALMSSLQNRTRTLNNLLPANKGILERNTDVDVFSFITGNGPINLSVNPWLQPAGTRGGNLDMLIELHNESGTLLITNNPASQTQAQIQTNLARGRYYLYIRGTGTGDPMSSTPTGYTSYGSVGQYFISGTLAPVPAPAPPTNLRGLD
jgi:hypothetical protein